MDELPQDIPSPFDETQGGDVQEPAFVINRADDRAEAEQTEETNMWGAESIALDSEVNDEETSFGLSREEKKRQNRIYGKLLRKHKTSRLRSKKKKNSRNRFTRSRRCAC